MNLNFKHFGEGEPIVILHGLYGSSDNWYTIGKALSTGYSVFLLDLRNHGQSPHSKDHTYKALSDDLLEFFVNQNIELANIVGHSMGGKAAMVFATEHPEYVKSLVVIDISPRSYKSLTDYSEHSVFHLNMMQAMINLQPERFTSRNDMDEELKTYIKSSILRQFILKNIYRTTEGTFTWKLNLQALIQALPEILDGIDPAKINGGLGIASFPVLFIKGAESNYLQESDIPLIKQIFPDASLKTIDHAGHWVHVEQPEEFLRLLKSFLKANQKIRFC